jgi:uncharacterized protein YkwD
MALAASAAPAAASDCAGADADPAASSLAAVAEATLCLLNTQRIDRGLPALRSNGRLARAADAHAEDMVARQYFAHDSLDGRRFSTRIKQAGYLPAGSRWFVGENLAWGTGSYATPRAIVRAWMKSSGHRANILERDFKEIGIGIERGNPRDRSGAGATYATEFGAVSTAESRRATRRAKSRSR